VQGSLDSKKLINNQDSKSALARKIKNGKRKVSRPAKGKKTDRRGRLEIEHFQRMGRGPYALGAGTRRGKQTGGRPEKGDLGWWVVDRRTQDLCKPRGKKAFPLQGGVNGTI